MASRERPRIFFGRKLPLGPIVEDDESVKSPPAECRGGCGATVKEDGDYCRACEGSGRADEDVVYPELGT